jgi:hypothetical protein
MTQRLPQGAPLAALTPDGKSLVAQAKTKLPSTIYPLDGKKPDFPSPDQPGKAQRSTAGTLCTLRHGGRKEAFCCLGTHRFLGAHDLRTGLSVAGFPLKGLERFNAFCMSGALLATAKDNALCLWDGRTGRLLHESRQDGRIGDIVMSAARQMVITVSAFELRFLDWETARL